MGIIQQQILFRTFTYPFRTLQMHFRTFTDPFRTLTIPFRTLTRLSALGLQAFFHPPAFPCVTF